MTRSGVAVAVAAAAVALAMLAAGAGDLVWQRSVVSVPPGTSVAAAAEAHPGGILELAPGQHGPFVVGHSVTVRSAPGAILQGPIRVEADGVRLEGLEIRGGPSGIIVRRAEAVELDGVSVLGAASHGIEVIEASATITGCRIAGLVSEYAQGIEVRNSNGRPRTVIEDCTIEGGREGIVSHVSRVEYHDNLVRGTSMRAIMITEMSEGLAAGNEVHASTGAALYCGDMSQCVFRDNVVDGIAGVGSGVRSQAGHGLVAEYYAMVHETGNDFRGLAGTPALLTTGSILTDDAPFGIWPRGWVGALPAIPISLAALVGLAAVRVAAGRTLRRRPEPQAAPGLDTRALAVIVTGFAVQTFHMVEHAVQIWQVHVADAEHRSGLVGQAVDIEWTHLAFNVAVLAFMVATWHLARRRSQALSGSRPAAAWFLAAIVVQGYHTFEHVVRAVQHVQTGLDPSPGIAGQFVDLVWFHYAINVAVEVGSAIGVVALVLEHRRGREAQLSRSSGWSSRKSPIAATSSSGHSS